MTAEDRFNASTWLVDRHVEAGDGDRVAVVQGERSTDYATLLAHVEAAGGGLRALGVRPEERVLLVASDRLEWVAAFLGALRIGAVPVPVSTMLTGGELAFLAADARARVAVVSEEFAPALPALAEAPELADVVVVPDAPEGGGGGAEAPRGVALHRWVDAMAPGAAEPALPDATVADSPGFWLYTSGTTGRPKGAMHRHADLRSTAETYARTVLRIGPSDRCYSVAKLFFAYGLGNSLTFPLSVGAATVLDPARPTPASVAEAVRRSRPSLFFAVPTFYAALLAAECPPDTFASARQAVSAGEALPAELFRRFEDRFGVEILDGIGSTEALHVFLSNHPGAVRPGTSGTPVEGYEAKLVDDDGAPVADDAPGHLYVKGDSVATGYWNRTAVNRRTYQGEWLRTGDVYARSADGYYTYQGRSDDMLKAGGIWVSPAEVEATLVEHPDVLEAAVVGAPDENGIERPVACVVPQPGRTLEAAALAEFCAARLASFKRPRRVVVLDDLPKTATGKIQRYRLRQSLGA